MGGVEVLRSKPSLTFFSSRLAQATQMATWMLGLATLTCSLTVRRRMCFIFRLLVLATTTRLFCFCLAASLPTHPPSLVSSAEPQAAEPEYDVPYRRDSSEPPLEAQNISPYMVLGRTSRPPEDAALYSRADGRRDDEADYMTVGAHSGRGRDDEGEAVYDTARRSPRTSGAPQPQPAPRRGEEDAAVYDTARRSPRTSGAPQPPQAQGSALYEEARSSPRGSQQAAGAAGQTLYDSPEPSRSARASAENPTYDEAGSAQPRSNVYDF